MHPAVGWQKANNVKNRFFFIFKLYLFVCFKLYYLYDQKYIIIYIIYYFSLFYQKFIIRN